MSLRRTLGIPPVAVLALLALPLGTIAQEATPVAAPGTVVAAGLTNPRGMTWGTDGTLFVALAGSGGSGQATEDAPTTEFLGPFGGGPTAAVARIDNGCPTPVVTGLPSTMTGTGEVLGAEDVAILGDQMYIAVDGGGAVHGNPDQPSGIYRGFAEGDFELLVDLSAWLRANPVANEPEDYDPDSDPYQMVADEANGLLWVLEPNVGGVLTITPDGTVTRVADLSEGHPVPAAIAVNPSGGVYVGFLTAVPFPDGASKVVSVTADGTVTDVWTGLTVVTGLAVGADGSLYALEMSTGNLQEPPFLMPNSGRIVHQTGADTLEVIADGLMFPIALEIGPDGAFYVSTPAIGANNGEGVILRIEAPGTGTPVAAPAAAPASCPPVPSTIGTPQATPVS